MNCTASLIYPLRCIIRKRRRRRIARETNTSSIRHEYSFCHHFFADTKANFLLSIPSWRVCCVCLLLLNQTETLYLSQIHILFSFLTDSPWITKHDDDEDGRCLRGREVSMGYPKTDTRWWKERFIVREKFLRRSLLLDSCLETSHGTCLEILREYLLSSFSKGITSSLFLILVLVVCFCLFVTTKNKLSTRSLFLSYTWKRRLVLITGLTHS